MMRSPFPAWEISELCGLVADSGFREVVVTIEIGSMRYPSVEEFLRREAASSPLAAPLGSMPREVRDALLRDLDDALYAISTMHWRRTRTIAESPSRWRAT